MELAGPIFVDLVCRLGTFVFVAFDVLATKGEDVRTLGNGRCRGGCGPAQRSCRPPVTQ
jgi:hypothetical protein